LEKESFYDCLDNPNNMVVFTGRRTSHCDLIF
jgi:hypothetical protein